MLLKTNLLKIFIANTAFGFDELFNEMFIFVITKNRSA